MSSSNSNANAAIVGKAQSNDVPQYKVEVWLYDLSMGIARQLSPAFIGKQIDGIWHTGVVVYGYEYFYGGGIQATLPGGTMAGQPIQKIAMGFTAKSQTEFHTFLHSISHRFSAATYSLLHHNCNNFSHEIVKFLTGRDLPAFITGLPAEAMNSPLGAMFRPMIEQMEAQFRNSVNANTAGAGMPGIPWGNSELQLPPMDATPDRYAPLEVLISAEGKVQEQAALTESDSDATERKIEANIKDAHAHTGLSLQIVTSSAHPYVTTEKKWLSFLALYRANSKKVNDDPITSDERTRLERVVNALNSQSSVETKELIQSVEYCRRAIHQWPPTLRFPALGLLSLFSLEPSLCTYFLDNMKNLLRELIATSGHDDSKSGDDTVPMAAQAITFCIIANFFNQPALGSAICRSQLAIGVSKNALSSEHQSVRLMAANVLFNAILTLPKDDSEEVMELVSDLCNISLTEEDVDVCIRLVAALAQLVYCNHAAGLVLATAEWDVSSILERFPTNESLKKWCHDVITLKNFELESLYG